jgi:hypothetical protein
MKNHGRDGFLFLTSGPAKPRLRLEGITYARFKGDPKFSTIGVA